MPRCQFHGYRLSVFNMRCRCWMPRPHFSCRVSGCYEILRPGLSCLFSLCSSCRWTRSTVVANCRDQCWNPPEPILRRFQNTRFLRWPTGAKRDTTVDPVEVCVNRQAWWLYESQKFKYRCKHGAKTGSWCEQQNKQNTVQTIRTLIQLSNALQKQKQSKIKHMQNKKKFCMNHSMLLK